jgi:ubiquinone/menaquinone biosynthesis C-methylase UbiE
MTNVPLSDLPDDEKSQRASSFGGVAENYDSFRPAPADAAIDWILGGRRLGAAIDLGAGTGACTRLLLAHADQVTAVEPDARMREILRQEVRGATVLEGRGESIPLPDASVDAVFASSSWHWMEPGQTLSEVARVLRPGGQLGVLWSGPDLESPFMVQARSLMEAQPLDAYPATDDGGSNGADETLANSVLVEADRPSSTLVIPASRSSLFAEPELAEFRQDLPLTADQLIGLMGTMSLFILMPEDRRLRIFGEARRLLKEALGVEGPVTVDVTFKTEAWRSKAI